MLSVQRVHLPSYTPIVGCELTPYVIVKRPDDSVINEDVTESNPVDGRFLRYKWFRIGSDKKFYFCSVHPTEQATLQCLACIKASVPLVKSCHCSTKCFTNAWGQHRLLHAASNGDGNRNGEEKIGGRSNSSAGSTNVPAVITQRSDGNTWFEVGRSKTYTPTSDDIGHVLKFECVVVDVETRSDVGNPVTLSTESVIPAPSPTPRRMIPVSRTDMRGNLDSESRKSSGLTFSVLSYNILSDAYAGNEIYRYCPSWALTWSYRRQNLLREIVGYLADIVCLQEVQFDHFEEFFLPELDKHGYQAIFKRKTTEDFGGNVDTTDGCATFFRRDRFAHVKNYEIEFNKAAQSLAEAQFPITQKKSALNRLVTDNIALIVVLEAKFSNQGIDNSEKHELICVANTHINVHQDLKDVKLWQVHSLLKGLEKIASSAEIPMLLCGDFNSVPGSAPHLLLSMGKVDPLHTDLTVDPLGILHQLTHILTHRLPLVSAYLSFARAGAGVRLEQKKRLDPLTNEPLFTSFTRDFIGTHDYIFYSADSLTVESLLELLDEDILRKDTALPSPKWSSDHIALSAEFCYNPKPRR